MSFSPPEDHLTSAIVDLKAQQPHLGIAKIHALLLANYPDWIVSEKRTRRILQTQGLVVPPTIPSGTPDPPIFPTSRLIMGLDLTQYNPKIQVKYFNNKKGKGLVAVEDIEDGEKIWQEDPFIIAPEWDIYDMQVNSTACAYCTTPLSPDSPLINNCASSSSSSSNTYCPARFCNRLCAARSVKSHPLLCPIQNPASVPLLKYAKDTQWMALHALTHLTSRVLLANQVSEEALASDWQVVQGLAELSLEDRFKYSFKTPTSAEPDRSTWKKAFNLYVQAFKEPKSPQDQKKLYRLLKKDLHQEIEQRLFDYDIGFLRGLGRMSLNLEAHGGLYTLHSHLNHSCAPNISIKHTNQRTALSRITAIAKQHIKKGEELTITYVHPKLGYTGRQEELRGWGFGACVCGRCVEEMKMMKQTPVKNEDLDELARELKAGLGVV